MTTEKIDVTAEVAVLTRVTLPVTHRQIADWFVAALEGGSHYWLDRCILKSKKHKLEGDAVNWYDNPATWRDPGLKVSYASEDPEHCGFITHASLIAGIQKFADLYPKNFAEMIDEDGNWDAGDADLFFQVVALGSCVYG